MKPEQVEQGEGKDKDVAIKEDATRMGRPSVRCMAALRESVVPALARRMQNVKDPREAWELLKPDITPDDSDEWGDKLLNIKITSFKSYLEYLDALQSLFNDTPCTPRIGRIGTRHGWSGVLSGVQIPSRQPYT